jgi:hypothetical protein
MTRPILLLLTVAAALPAPAAPTCTPPADANLLIDVSQDLASAAARQTIDRPECITDEILKTRIHGPGQTHAEASVEFVPDDREAALDLVLKGVTWTDTVGVNGPVRLYNSGATTFLARKRIYLNADGLFEVPAGSCADVDAPLNRLTTKFRGPLDPIVKRVALRIYQRDKPKADAIARAHARQRVNEGFDRDAEQQLAEGQRSYLSDLRGPLERRGIWAQQLHFRTTTDTLSVTARLEDTAGPTHPGPPPALVGAPALAVRIHESLLNNGAVTLFANRTFTGEELDAEVASLLGPLAKQLPAAPPDREPFSITFSEQPVTVRFADHGFRVTISGKEFTSGDREYEGMDTTAVYRLEKTAVGLKAVRQGEIESFPPGFVRGRDRLGVRQQTQRRLLARRFSKFFPPTMELGPVKLPGDLAKVGELHTTQADADAGWLALAWRRVPSAGP